MSRTAKVKNNSSCGKYLNLKKPRKSTTSEQKTKPKILTPPQRVPPEIKEEEVEEEPSKGVVELVQSKPGVENNPYSNASLGMGYFFGEGQVPKEVEDLLLKYQNYTYGTKHALYVDRAGRI